MTATIVKQRDSNLELFRIISMFAIVAHHYVVNSGVLLQITENGAWSKNSIFALLFGMFGKTGINCFMLITGFFMCQSSISLKKYFKLLTQVEFYKIVIFLIFVISGYSDFSVKELVKAILPVFAIQKNFVGCFLVFYLVIPFLNVLIQGLTKKQHQLLLLFCMLFFVILPQLKIKIDFNYVGWFSVIYFIGSYLRLYPIKLLGNARMAFLGMVLSITASISSVIAGAYIFEKTGGGKVLWYRFVSDSNAILALTVAVFAFSFFKNINIGCSKIINTIAASSFGVLLIHANSDTMRAWLWGDFLKNTSYFHTNEFALHALISVLSIYVVCTLIEFVRIRTVEKICLNWFDKSVLCKRITHLFK